MRSAISLALLILSAAAAPAGDLRPAGAVKERVLANGMRLLVAERHISPTIAAGWVARVGSIHDPDGATGLAHLLEHMMFKGTRTIGTRDPDREAEVLSRIDAIRTQMDTEIELLRQAMRRGEIDHLPGAAEDVPPRLGDLRRQAAELRELHRSMVVRDEFDRIYQAAGATEVNAGTAADYTMYLVTLPANKIELWFWMESDRLLDPVFREFYVERDVVREERLTRIDSDPIAAVEEAFDASFWMSLGYRHPATGWPSDIVSIRRGDAESFFRSHYAPDNLTAVLVGDLDPAEVTNLAERYFGRIPRRDAPPPAMVTEEVRQVAERRLQASADANPSVQIRWHTAPFVHGDVWALDLLSDLLDGRAGRLHQVLVDRLGVAVGEPWAWVDPRRYAGCFEIGAEVADGHSHREVESAMIAEVERLKRERPAGSELDRVTNRNLARRYRDVRTNKDLLHELLTSDGLGDWRVYSNAPQAIRAVTPDAISAVARTYFTTSGINVLWIERDGSLAAADGGGPPESVR